MDAEHIVEWSHNYIYVYTVSSKLNGNLYGYPVMSLHLAVSRIGDLSHAHQSMYTAVCKMVVANVIRLMTHL